VNAGSRQWSPVEYRQLGESGLRVSAVTFGNWLTQDSSEVSAARTSVYAALDLGVTTFDTADVYGEPIGRAEELLGAALSGIRRGSVEVMTKVCMRTGPGANDRGLSRKHIIESCHGSLRRLGTDYIDVYLAHRYDSETPLEETMAAFADLVRMGKVLHVGVSEWTASQIEAAVKVARPLGLRLVSNQAQYSILWRVVEAEVLPTCARLGLGQVVFSPLAQGVLTGKYRPGEPPAPETRAAGGPGARYAGRYMSEPLLRAVQRLNPIAGEVGLTLAQLAVAWVLGQPHVATAVVGASRPPQLRENTAAVGTRLGADVLAAVDRALVDPEHGDLVERDPAKTARLFDVKPVWRAETATAA
jgi:aryl-alcohol dehydrogenase-like predicted oxidoreductase